MSTENMGNSLKKQFSSIIYYISIFGSVSYLFSGFILLKLPFPLSYKFKSLLQQGINLPNLDVAYVSAISWCVVLVFGLNSIMQHIDTRNEFSMVKEQQRMMQQPMESLTGGQEQIKALVNAEKESIQILPKFSLLDDSVEEVISKYQYLLN